MELPLREGLFRGGDTAQKQRGGLCIASISIIQCSMHVSLEMFVTKTTTYFLKNDNELGHQYILRILVKLGHIYLLLKHVANGK